MFKLKYIGKKFVQLLITLYAIITCNFFLFRILPGDPVRLLSRSGAISQESLNRIYELFGLDEPMWMQYLIYLKNMVTGQFGISIKYRTDVGTIISERMGNTLLLLAGATVLIIVIGIGAGIIAAMRRGSRTDKVLLVASMTGWSLPTFWTGLLMIIVFGVFMGALPVSGIATPGAVYASGGAMVMDYVRHLIMPTIALIIVDMAEFFLITRSTLVDVMTEDYILTAKGKGLSEKKVLWRHALPNGMLPIITTLALYVSLVIGGAIQVETVFSYPGMGQLMYDAVLKRDYPILEASFFLFATVTLFANFISDILYMIIDPRVKEL